MDGFAGGVFVIATIIWVYGRSIIAFVAGLRNAIMHGQGPGDQDL